MWVEMHLLSLSQSFRPVILFMRMWVEMIQQQEAPIFPQSSSSWGCELKWGERYRRNPESGHPLREDVSWNISDLRNLVEGRVILLVRMWVEITDAWEERKLNEVVEKICVGFVGTCEKFYTDESWVPMYRTGNLNGLSLNRDDLKYVKKEFHKHNQK